MPQDRIRAKVISIGNAAPAPISRRPIQRGVLRIPVQQASILICWMLKPKKSARIVPMIGSSRVINPLPELSLRGTSDLNRPVRHAIAGRKSTLVSPDDSGTGLSSAGYGACP